jgi:hypothetical protein
MADEKYGSLNEANRRNGIRGCAAPARRIEQYGRRYFAQEDKGGNDRRDRRDEGGPERIRELEAALANAHMDYCLESAVLNIACRQMGTTTEELIKEDFPFAQRALCTKRFPLLFSYIYSHAIYAVGGHIALIKREKSAKKVKKSWF